MADETPMSDPRLSALLFGELDDPELRELEAAVDADPALEAELLSLLDTSALLEEALTDEARSHEARSHEARSHEARSHEARSHEAAGNEARSHEAAGSGGRRAHGTRARLALASSNDTLRVWGSFAAAAALVLAVVVGINTGGARLAEDSPADRAPEETDGDSQLPASQAVGDSPAFAPPVVATPEPPSPAVHSPLAQPPALELAEQTATDPSADAADPDAADPDAADPDAADPDAADTDAAGDDTRQADASEASTDAHAEAASDSPPAADPAPRSRRARRRGRPFGTVAAGNASSLMRPAPRVPTLPRVEAVRGSRETQPPPTAADPPPRRVDEAALLDAFKP